METIASGSTKRAAPEGTPDREAEARSKIQSTDLVPKALPELTESVSKVEMSAATISLLRTMIRDEIKNGMLEMEHRFSAKLDNAIGEVKEELCVERASRQQLEERVAKLEQQHVREQTASTAQMFEDEDVTKNLQSVRADDRWNDFVSELEALDYDIVFCTETWREEREEHCLTPSGQPVSGTGGKL